MSRTEDIENIRKLVESVNEPDVQIEALEELEIDADSFPYVEVKVLEPRRRRRITFSQPSNEVLEQFS